MKFYRKLGAKLRKHREWQGFSQEEMGKVIGVSFQMVQKYENGSCRIPVDRLYKLSTLWSFDLNDILNECK